MSNFIEMISEYGNKFLIRKSAIIAFMRFEENTFIWTEQETFTVRNDYEDIKRLLNDNQ